MAFLDVRESLRRRYTSAMRADRQIAVRQCVRDHRDLALERGERDSELARIGFPSRARVMRNQPREPLLPDRSQVHCTVERMETECD